MFFSRISVFVLLAYCVMADTRAGESIDTDGPDFVESSEVVAKGRTQLEVDVVSERDRRDLVRRTTSTPTLVRHGITDTLELRVETEGRVWSTSEAPDSGIRSNEKGNGDTSFGLKWHSHDRDPATYSPAVSWIAHLEAPTGDNGFKGDGLRPSLRSVATWELPNALALGIMPGVKYETRQDGHRFVAGMLGVVLNKQWRDNFRTFVESAVPQIAKREDGGVLAFWDIGAAILVNRDWQIGLRGAIAANRNTPNTQLLFEIAARF